MWRENLYRPAEVLVREHDVCPIVEHRHAFFELTWIRFGTGTFGMTGETPGTWRGTLAYGPGTLLICSLYSFSVMENPPFSDDSEGRQHSLLSPLDYPPARTGGAVNGGRSPFILTVDCSGWLCYLLTDLWNSTT